MKSIKVTKAKDNLLGLIDEAAKSHEPLQIMGKRSNAVLVAEEDWNTFQETLYLLSVPKMRESIVEGLNTNIDECKSKN